MITALSPSYIRPPYLQGKSCLIREMASFEGINLAITISVHLKSDLIGEYSLMRGSTVISAVSLLWSC